MPEKSFMEALFGKKRRVVKRKAPKRKSTKKLPKVLKTMAKKHGVNVTLKRGGKRVEKSEKLLKKQITMAKRRAAKKKATKSRKNVAPKRRVKRRVKRRTANFGKGAGFPPLSSVMSPYPFSVNSSPPWI